MERVILQNEKNVSFVCYLTLRAKEDHSRTPEV